VRDRLHVGTFSIGAEDLPAWKIACRKLVFDQNVLSPKNVSIFF
jgi:hypothetical protein